MPDERRARISDAGYGHRFRGEVFDAAQLISVNGPELLWFSRCSFIGADLRQATLDGWFFLRCDFRRADLRGASLRHVRLTSCDLRDADLRSADLSSAEFSQANTGDPATSAMLLDGARWDGAILDDVLVDPGIEWPCR